MSDQITPLRDLGALPTHGRIRTGEKRGRAMAALSCFRLTSADKAALETLAEIYGGSVKPWKDPKASPPNQWQLYTESDTLDVVVGAQSFDINYELWSGGGIKRQCDAETATTWDYVRDDVIKEEVPCVCSANGLRECDLKTRINFIFPSIPFAGVWRYETKSYDGAMTLPTMLRLIESLQSEKGLVPLTAHIVDRQKQGGRKKFKVVELRTSVSVDQMLAGTGSYQAQLDPSGVAVPELANPSSVGLPPSSLTDPPLPSSDSTIVETRDDEIVDAELVEDEEEPEGQDEGSSEQILTRSEAFALAKETGRVAKKIPGGKPNQWTVVD